MWQRPIQSPMPIRSDETSPTRWSLVRRLKDWDDHESWRDFFNTYWKLIYSAAMQSGLTDAEAQEVVQETVITVAKKMSSFKADPAFGSFKGWLARNIMGEYRAVKIVYRESFDSDRPYEREFHGIRQFEPISRSHPSQVNILHVGKGEGCFFYVMELADDGSEYPNDECPPGNPNDEYRIT